MPFKACYCSVHNILYLLLKDRFLEADKWLQTLLFKVSIIHMLHVDFERVSYTLTNVRLSSGQYNILQAYRHVCMLNYFQGIKIIPLSYDCKHSIKMKWEISVKISGGHPPRPPGSIEMSSSHTIWVFLLING